MKRNNCERRNNSLGHELIMQSCKYILTWLVKEKNLSMDRTQGLMSGIPLLPLLKHFIFLSINFCLHPVVRFEVQTFSEWTFLYPFSSITSILTKLYSTAVLWANVMWLLWIVANPIFICKHPIVKKEDQHHLCGEYISFGKWWRYIPLCPPLWKQNVQCW